MSLRGLLHFYFLVMVQGTIVFGQDMEETSIPQDSVTPVSRITQVSGKRALAIPTFQLHLTDTLPLGPNDILIHDSYTALGRKYVYDALHAFNRRRMDHFGGLLNEKINAGLAEIRKGGFNSDVKQLVIQIDPSTLTVYWTAVVGPSENGKCYTHVDSRGSAGGGLPAVQKQFPRMHSLHQGLVPEQLLEFNENVVQCYDWNGVKLDSAYNVINIRQHFFKYADPTVTDTETLAATIPTETEQVAAPAAPVKKAPVNRTHRSYTVKEGDTLSGIAAKFHVSISQLKKANSLRSDRIRAGQRLRIP